MSTLALETTRGAPAARGLSIEPAAAVSMAVFALVAGNLGRIPILNLGERAAPLLVSDVALLVAIGVGALAMLRSRSVLLDHVALTALAFAAVGAGSAISAMPRFGLSANELVASLAYLARWCVYFALYVVIINTVVARQVERVWSAMETALLFMAAFGIVQAAFLPDFAFTVYSGARRVLDWDPQGHRLVSTVLEPNVMAVMLVIGLLVQAARLSVGVRVPAWRVLLLLLALVLTLSRSGALALLVGGAVVVTVTGVGRRMARLAGIVAVVSLLALPKLVSFAAVYDKLTFANDSALTRLLTWQRAITTFLENPWFGVGFNTYGFVQARRGIERLGTASYSAEGGLLFIAVMTGVIGLLCYLMMLRHVWRNCRRMWLDATADANERGLAIGAAAATVAVLVHSVFVNTLLMPFVMEQLWLLWGLVFVLRSRRAAA